MTAVPLDSEGAAASIRFVTQGLAAEEIAAVTAVLSAAVSAQTLAADSRSTAVPASTWTRSMRVRTPLRKGWRGFAG